MITDADAMGVGKRYALQRDNFILDPVHDTACFARHDIDTRGLAESLNIDLVTGLAPKRLVWGPYGGGKTHTLMRTMKELGDLTNVQAIRVECPDLSKKARFHDLFRDGIMREMGQDFVVGLLEEAVLQVPMGRRDEYLAALKAKFGDEAIAKAVSRIIDPNFDRLRLWRWISGVSMSRQDLNDLGQTQDLTQMEAARLADIVILFGRLLRDMKQQTLVLILDEMERLRTIGPETIPTFVTGFTRLADPGQNVVSILIGASAAVQVELVDVFSTEGPVVTRLGKEAQVEIPALPDPDVTDFIKGVIAYVRDPNADVAGLMAGAKNATTETLDQGLFPFTEEAIDSLKSHLTLQMTPREITINMTRALGRAHLASKSAITADCIR